MNKTNIIEFNKLENYSDPLTQLIRQGAQDVIRCAIEAEIGPVTVKIPKVRSKTGEPVSFKSALVPPYVRKTRTLEAALPWLYLKGLYW